MATGLVWEEKTVLGTDGGDGCTTACMYLTPQESTLQNGDNSKCMLCRFDHNKKNTYTQMCVDQRKTAVFVCHIITTICSPPWKMQLWRAIPESTAPPTCTQQTSSWRNHGESTQRCPNLAINITASSNVVGPEHLHTDPYIFFINDLPFILLFQVSTKSTTRCIYRVDQKAGSGSSVNQLIEEPKGTFWPSQNIKVSCEFCFMIALMAFHNISYKNQGKCEWL